MAEDLRLCLLVDGRKDRGPEETTMKRVMPYILTASICAIALSQSSAAIINPSFEDVDSQGAPRGWVFFHSYRADIIVDRAQTDTAWATHGSRALALMDTHGGGYYYYGGDHAGVRQEVLIDDALLRLDVRKMHITGEWDYEGWIRARVRIDGVTLWESPRAPVGVGQPPQWVTQLLHLDVSSYRGATHSLSLEVFHDTSDFAPGGGWARGWSADNIAWGPWVQFDSVGLVPSPSGLVAVSLGVLVSHRRRRVSTVRTTSGCSSKALKPVRRVECAMRPGKASITRGLAVIAWAWMVLPSDTRASVITDRFLVQKIEADWQYGDALGGNGGNSAVTYWQHWGTGTFQEYVQAQMGGGSDYAHTHVRATLSLNTIPNVPLRIETEAFSEGFVLSSSSHFWDEVKINFYGGFIDFLVTDQNYAYLGPAPLVPMSAGATILPGNIVTPGFYRVLGNGMPATQFRVYRGNSAQDGPHYSAHEFSFTPVPAPASLALLGMLGMRWKRRVKRGDERAMPRRSPEAQL